MGSIVVTVATASSGGDIPITDATVSWADAAGTHSNSAGVDGSVTIELTNVSQTFVTASAPQFDSAGKRGYSGVPLLIELSETGSGGGGTSPASPPAPPSQSLAKPSNLVATWIGPEFASIRETFEVPKGATGYQGTAEFQGNLPADNKEYRSPLEPIIGPASVSLLFEDVEAGFYYMHAFAGDSNSATEADISLNPPPPGVSNFQASWIDGYTAVAITWNQSSGTTATTIELQRYPGSVSGTPQATATNPSSPYTDRPADISATSTYQYQLIASNTNGTNTVQSNRVPPPQAPPAPKNVVAKWTISKSSPPVASVSVTWGASPNADSYEVILFASYAISVAPYTQLQDHKNITSTTWDETLTPEYSTEYNYEVIAHNRFGSNSSAKSNGLQLPLPTSPPSPPGPPPSSPLSPKDSA